MGVGQLGPAAQRHDDPDMQAEIRHLLDGDVVPLRIGAAQRLEVGQTWHDLDEIDVTDGLDLARGRQQIEFVGVDLLPESVEQQRPFEGRQSTELVPNPLRLVQIFALALEDREPTELERILEGLLDAHIEPTVDAALDELEREEIDDRDRHEDEDDEDQDQADREPRPRHVIAVLADQAQQVVANQDDEQDEARHIEQQQPEERLSEITRPLHGRAQAIERDEQGNEQKQYGEEAAGQSFQKRIGHEYQSLSRVQSEDI